MQNTRAQPSRYTPFFPIMRVTVFVVPMTPSPMMIRPNSPRRSAIWVALNESLLQMQEMLRVPTSSNNITMYTPTITPVTLDLSLENPVKRPPYTIAAIRKTPVFTTSGRVSWRCVFLREEQKIAVTRYWRASQKRLRNKAQHNMRKTYCWLVESAHLGLPYCIGVSYPMWCGLHKQIEFISHKRESREGREVNDLARPLPDRVGGKSRIETNDVKPCHP